MTLRRRVYRLRIRFHDWMWNPEHRAPRLRRACQKLPLWFSDPYYISPKRFDEILARNPVTVTRGPRAATYTWAYTTEPSPTYSTATNLTIKYSTWPMTGH